MRRTLIISDLHIPWHHPDALEFCCAVRDKYKTVAAISVGDELDWHSISFHDHDPDMPSPADELALAKKEILRWKKEFPRLLLARSNHGDLMRRKMITAGLPEAAMVTYGQLYNTPGWSWHDEIIENMHGIPLVIRHDFGGNIKSALLKVGDACIAYGHRHTSHGVIYRQNLRYMQWAMAVGCLINPRHRAFYYGRNSLDRPTLGVGVVADGMATAVPMWIRADGRWMGKVS